MTSDGATSFNVTKPLPLAGRMVNGAIIGDQRILKNSRTMSVKKPSNTLLSKYICVTHTLCIGYPLLRKYLK